MASPGKTELVLPSSRDFKKAGTGQDVELSPGTTRRNELLKGWSFSFRPLCILGTVFVLVMGILSRSYLESPFRILRQQSFDVRSEVKALSQYQSLNDTDWSLKILENDSVEASSRPNGKTPSESADQEGESGIEQGGRYRETTTESDLEFGSRLQPENPAADENDIEDRHTEEQGHTQQGEKRSTVDIDAQQHKVKLAMTSVDEQEGYIQGRVEETKPGYQSTLSPAKIVDFPKEQDKLHQKDKEDGHNLRARSVDKGLEDSMEEQNSSLPVEVILQPVGSSARTLNTTCSKDGCDMTVGKWVHDPTGPLYRPDECSILSNPQNCQRNGRPDRGYEFYKWEPDHCSLPRFDAAAFLELMRGKTLAFIGDSLARNQMESLMCILLQVAQARAKGSKDVHRWYFASHEFTVIRMWSSWLVQKKVDFPKSEVPPGVTKLNLTELDDYAKLLPSFDVTILSSGHWWLRKTAYFMYGEMMGGKGWQWLPSYGEMKMNLSQAFEIALDSSLRKVSSYPGYKGLTILRTYTPDHYSGGSWDTGGSCTGETQPYEEGPSNSFNEMMRDTQVKAFEINTREYRDGVMPNGSKLRLLDVYSILNHRGDGHPGPYRNTNPHKQTTRDSSGHPPPQDCLHWCMPGPVDTTNELLFDLLKKEMK